MKCTACGVNVKEQNIRKHFATAHPKLPVPDSPQPRRQRQPVTRGTKRVVGIAILAVVILVPLAILLHGVQVPNGQPFPCVNGDPLFYHWHTTLTVTDSAGGFTVPANVGIGATCIEPVHTHDTSGTLHVETDVNRHYTLGDFLSIWGKPFASPTRMVVNGTTVAPTAGQVLWDGETIALTYSGVAFT